MTWKLNDTMPLPFFTHLFTTGVATNADSTPTVSIRKDGVNMSYSPTPTAIGSGRYEVLIVMTAINGFAVGSTYSVSVTATISSVAVGSGLASFRLTTNGIEDIPTAAQIATAVMASVIETGYTLTNTLRVIAASTAGKLSGVLAGLPIYRAIDDSKARVSGTVTTDGRTAVTLDVT